MATTRAALLADLKIRLGDTTWIADASLKNLIDGAIEGLYPTYYKPRTATTVAGVGPSQTLPYGARNLYQVGILRTNGTRVKPLVSWSEDVGAAFVPKVGITGQTLVWSWTEGWKAPAADSDVIDLPTEAREVVVLRSHVGALEYLLSNRAINKRDEFYAQQVRQSITEEEVLTTIDSLNASIKQRLDRALPLPAVLR